LNAFDVEVINKYITSNLVENILNVEQIINDHKTFVKIVPQEGF
jgi:arginine deiminase